MILSDSLSQPYALLFFSILGIAFGILYMSNYFLCTFLIKSAVYRHLSQSIYVITYAVAVFLCLLCKFDYNIHVYHIFITVSATVLTSVSIYFPIYKYNGLITQKCNTFKQSVSQSKIIKKLKK